MKRIPSILACPAKQGNFAMQSAQMLQSTQLNVARKSFLASLCNAISEDSRLSWDQTITGKKLALKYYACNEKLLTYVPSCSPVPSLRPSLSWSWKKHHGGDELEICLYAVSHGRELHSWHGRSMVPMKFNRTNIQGSSDHLFSNLSCVSANTCSVAPHPGA